MGQDPGIASTKKTLKFLLIYLMSLVVERQKKFEIKNVDDLEKEIKTKP